MKTPSAPRMTLAALATAVSLVTTSAHADPTINGSPVQQESHEGRTMRTAGWLTLGGAFAALVGSVVMFRLSAAKPSAEASPSDVSDRNDSIRHEHGAGEVLLFAGAVAAATGVSLILLAPKDKASPHIAIGMGSVVLGGSF